MAAQEQMTSPRNHHQLGQQTALTSRPEGRRLQVSFAPYFMHELNCHNQIEKLASFLCR